MANNNGAFNGASKIALRASEQSLKKATLNSLDGGGTLEFQFNPKEISFSTRVTLSKGKGARAQESGFPRVSYGNLEANTISIKNIYFDTYEYLDPGINVVDRYIVILRNFVRFVGGGQERTHILDFRWGNHLYVKRCFIESFDYRLTMFLPDGTPVRAVIDNLTLVETDATPAEYRG